MIPTYRVTATAEVVSRAPRYLGDFAKARGIKLINRERAAVRRARVVLRKAVRRQLVAYRVAAVKQLATALGLEKADDDIARRVKRALDDLDLEGYEAFADIIGAELDLLFRDGARAAERQLDVELSVEAFERVSGRAAAFGRDRAADMVGMKWEGDVLVPNPNAEWRIDDSTREMLRADVTAALEEGWSTDRLAQQLEANYAFSDVRADTIARTETATADVAGAMTGYRESGVVKGKRWLTAEDDLVSDECNDCARVEVIGLDDLFPTGVDAPPNHPNCRCAVVPVLDDEIPVLLGGI